jgi:hypothetical protein
MQKKNYFLTMIALLALISIAGAKQVDLISARRTGVNFYYERASQYHDIRYNDLKIKETFTEMFNGKNVYYIFNLDGNGYVIVSADDAVTPVLGYSFDGTYSTANQPPQFIDWMTRYAQQIDHSLSHDLTATAEIKGEWNRLAANDPSRLTPLRTTMDVTPLLISTWDQGGNYNMLCPADAAGPGGHVWAGCVATAMAQVMYYYRWPETGVGQHCYNPSGYPQQCADYGNTTYQWNEMLNSLPGPDTAVATLIWHCGISVNMMYSPSGSGAYSDDAAAAFRNNFKYSQDAQLLYKDNYSEDQWAQILRDNLDLARPLYYHGFGTGGHAFNVDGYQGLNYFHFNWGWSGSYNGYFYLTNLNPGGNNFTSGQGAIVNIYPDTTLYNYPEYCQGPTTLTNMKGTIEDGSGPQNYQPNANCSWLISPTSNSDSITSITLNFNRFNTEGTNDILTVYEGGTTVSPVAAQFSGDNMPGSLTVNSNKALVTFTSNGSVSKPGWFISYTSESMDWCEGMTVLSTPSGTVSDGSQDFNYKNSTLCRFRIGAEGSTDPLTLYFTSFNTEAGHDKLSIYDLGSEQLIAEISGDYTSSNLPAPVTAPGGQMFIIFVTDNVNNDLGWEGYWNTYPVGVCTLPAKADVSIYPNPASGSLNLRMTGISSGEIRTELLNVEGKSVLTGKFVSEKNQPENKLDITGVPGGIYFLKLVGSDFTVTKKIVIR